MRRVLEDTEEKKEYIDEGVLAAVVYELARLGVKKATRYRVHPLQNKAVLEVEDDPKKVLEAIKRVKEQLLEIKEQICK